MEPQIFYQLKWTVYITLLFEKETGFFGVMEDEEARNLINPEDGFPNIFESNIYILGQSIIES